MTESHLPRSGPGRDIDLIIDRPELQARRHRWIYSTLTLIAWVVWMYLWLPVVTFIAWYFGVRTFLREVVIPSPGHLFGLAMTYLAIIAVMGVILILWSRYNLGRFGGKDRRKEPADLADADLQKWFDISASQLMNFRTQRTLVVEHGEVGEVVEVKAGSIADVSAGASDDDALAPDALGPDAPGGPGEVEQTSA